MKAIRTFAYWSRRTPIAGHARLLGGTSTFLEVLVVSRPLLAGNQREALLAVADQLSIELGYAEGGEPPAAYARFRGEGAVVGILNSEDEHLVMALRTALANLAAALGRGSDAARSAVAGAAALDGAEMVMRGELVIGNAEALPHLMPSFVFLVALPVVDQDRALELARRATRLLQAAIG